MVTQKLRSPFDTAVECYNWDRGLSNNLSADINQEIGYTWVVLISSRPTQELLKLKGHLFQSAMLVSIKEYETFVCRSIERVCIGSELWQSCKLSSYCPHQA